VRARFQNHISKISSIEEDEVEISDDDRCSSLVRRCDVRLPERPGDRGGPLSECDRSTLADTGDEEDEGVTARRVVVVVRPPSSLDLDLEPDERFFALERRRRSNDAVLPPL